MSASMFDATVSVVLSGQGSTPLSAPTTVAVSIEVTNPYDKKTHVMVFGPSSCNTFMFVSVFVLFMDNISSTSSGTVLAVAEILLTRINSSKNAFQQNIIDKIINKNRSKIRMHINKFKLHIPHKHKIKLL